MKVLKIKNAINRRCWFNYIDNRLENEPRYIVELTNIEFHLLVGMLKEKNSE